MQQNYSVTKIELLAVVETLKEFKGMLWGQEIKVFTDHKNLTRDTLGLTSDRVYWRRLLLEEYAPKIMYIKGIHNIVADIISWLDYNLKLNTTHEYTHAKVGVGVSSEEMRVQRWKSLFCTIGEASMKAMLQRKLSAFQWTKCLQIPARRTKYGLSWQQNLPRPSGLLQAWNTSWSAMQKLIKDWRSNSLRT